MEHTPESSHTGRKTGRSALPLLQHVHKFKNCPKGIIKVAKIDARNISKILVVAPSWVGDTMLIQPLLVRLKQRHPGCLIDVLAPPWTETIRQMPEVNNTITNQFPHGAMQLAARFGMGIHLRGMHYDQAIV